MKFLLHLGYWAHVLLAKCRRWYLRAVLKSRFARFGRRFSFDPDGYYSFGNIEVGEDVNLGYRPLLMAGESRIIIGNHVMFGPHVTIVAGDHNTALGLGFMIDVKLKLPGNDRDVVIEDDVWIAANAVILKGVTIGRGAVVGAGAVVTKAVPPYAIVAGNPARVLRYRGSTEEIAAHGASLQARR